MDLYTSAVFSRNVRVDPASDLHTFISEPISTGAFWACFGRYNEHLRCAGLKVLEVGCGLGPY